MNKDDPASILDESPALTAFNGVIDDLNAIMGQANVAYILVAVENATAADQYMCNSNIDSLDVRIRMMQRTLRALKDEADRRRRGTRAVVP